MLQSIRDHSQGWLSKLILGTLVLLFSFWGLHGYLTLETNNNKPMATVGGQTLSKEDFDRIFERLYHQIQIKQGHYVALNKPMRQALESYIIAQWRLQQLLSQAAYRANYRVSEAMLDAALLSISNFKNDSGQFSSRRFYAVIDAMGYSEQKFLADLKQNLLINQVKNGIESTSFCLPSELNYALSLKNKKKELSTQEKGLLKQSLTKKFANQDYALYVRSINADS